VGPITFLGPGPSGAAAVAPIVPPAGLPAAIPQVAIPAVPRPPVQFIPSAPGPLLPPIGRLGPLQAPAQYPEIPVIPESDTVVLLLGGLAALGAVAVVRRRHDD
jgi:MYXO-CTERM domain-containing protein